MLPFLSLIFNLSQKKQHSEYIVVKDSFLLLLQTLAILTTDRYVHLLQNFFWKHKYPIHFFCFLIIQLAIFNK